jgi:hypothetical protein
MPIYLGNTSVSVYLGSASPSVYLGSTLVGSNELTMFWYDTVDDQWTTLGNWFLDSLATTPAPRLPGPADTVTVYDELLDDVSETMPTVAEFFADGATVSMMVAVTGLATFSGAASLAPLGQIYGDAVFNGTSTNQGSVNGFATFNDSSMNDAGFVEQEATFNDSSVNAGEVIQTATFTGSACNDGGLANTFVPDPPPSC